MSSHYREEFLQIYMSESIVQKKLAKLILQQLGEIIRLTFDGGKGVMITVSLVRVTADLSLAKVYVSVLPDKRLDEISEALNEDAWRLRKELAKRIRNKVRKIPDLRFYSDDSFIHAERIDSLLNQISTDEPNSDL
ncbi:MAG: 30S ribosome-binding factor RbfA [Bacteroidota bacterium]